MMMPEPPGWCQDAVRDILGEIEGAWVRIIAAHDPSRAVRKAAGLTVKQLRFAATLLPGDPPTAASVLMQAARQLQSALAARSAPPCPHCERYEDWIAVARPLIEELADGGDCNCEPAVGHTCEFCRARKLVASEKRFPLPNAALADAEAGGEEKK